MTYLKKKIIKYYYFEDRDYNMTIRDGLAGSNPAIYSKYFLFRFN